MEKPTTESRDVDMIQSHNIDEPITNVDISNKNVEKPTTSLISSTPSIHNQGTYYVFNMLEEPIRSGLLLLLLFLVWYLRLLLLNINITLTIFGIFANTNFFKYQT